MHAYRDDKYLQRCCGLCFLWARQLIETMQIYGTEKSRFGYAGEDGAGGAWEQIHLHKARQEKRHDDKGPM